MPAQPDPANLSVGQFAERCRREMIPLKKPFSYFFAALPLTEEDIREYLEEPIAALPPSVLAQLPRVSILLVPYLEKKREKGKSSASGEMVRLEKPLQNGVSWLSCVVSKEEAILAFALKDQEVADYHYRFYHLLAELVADQWSEEARQGYLALLRDEIRLEINGEVDEESWILKQNAQRRQAAKRESKLFMQYARQSFIDTMTLYMHGICCDIDVETGPRQLPSRFLRKRLQLLRTLYPPPEGYAVFPEEVKGA